MPTHRSARQRKQAPLNEPAFCETTWYACLVAPPGFGGYNAEIIFDSESDEEIERYNSDPDAYAAEHFGFADVDDYREWVECEGRALCSERTKAGHLCTNNAAVERALTPAQWRERHRSEPCTLHGGVPVPPTRSARSKTAPDDKRCDALARGTGRRCNSYGHYFRHGRVVCVSHRDAPTVEYVAENRFAALPVLGGQS